MLDILRIARKEKAKTATKKRTKRQQVEKTPEKSDYDEDDESEYSSNDSIFIPTLCRRRAAFAHVLI